MTEESRPDTNVQSFSKQSKPLNNDILARIETLKWSPMRLNKWKLEGMKDMLAWVEQELDYHCMGCASERCEGIDFTKKLAKVREALE